MRTDRSCQVNSPDAGLRLDITLMPKGVMPKSKWFSLCGASPRYNVLVEVQAVPPHTQGICFATDLYS
ncbi:MAG: hypothetical protein KAX78_00610 [Phycisphaerae bacterium]|nr:hypothetical protein [Phycisphaerae bacterium]